MGAKLPITGENDADDPLTTSVIISLAKSSGRREDG